jgi:hypothetical protein
LHFVAAAAVVGSIIAAVVAWIALGDVPARSEPAPDEGTPAAVPATD